MLLAHASMKSHLSGVRQLQVAHGWNDPGINLMPRLCQLLKGIKIESGQGKPSCSRLPITPTILRKIKAGWIGNGTPTFEASMLWVASLTTFFSFCQSGEITVESKSKCDPNTHLLFSDLAVDNANSPSIISLNIECSKTDQDIVGC